MKFLALLLFASSALAASSGSLVLSGSVATNCSLSVNSNNTNLDIVGGESNKLVATISENCNDPNGYKVSVSSSNNGYLVNGNTKTPYALSYDGGPAVSLISNQVAKTVNSLTSATSTASNVSVNVTALTNALAGTFSDTLIFTITAE